MSGDPRPARSRQALIDALTAMLDADTPAESISIADLVRAAGVSRPIFYQYFGDLATLIHAAALARLEAAFARVPEAARGESWTMFARDTFRDLLSDLQSHAPFFLRALQGPGGAALTADIVRFLADKLLDSSPIGSIIRRQPGAGTPIDRARFLAAGTVWHVVQWLESDFAGPDTLEAAVDRISSLLLSASGASDAERTAAGAGIGIHAAAGYSRE